MILAFMETQIPQILFNLLQYTLIHYVLLCIQYALLDITASRYETLQCSLIIALCYLIVIYGIDLICYCTGWMYPYWLLCMVILTNPLLAVVYYFVIKHMQKLTPNKSAILLRNHVLMHHLVVLGYLALCKLLRLFMNMIEIMPQFYLHEIIAVFLVIAALIAAHRVIAARLNRTRRYITLPPNYLERDPHRYLFQTFFSITGFYAMIVLFHWIWVGDHYEPVTPTTLFLYSLLFMSIVFYLMLSLSRLRTHVLEHEIQATGTYVSSLLKVNQELRAFRHDSVNILQAYGGYLAIEDYEGLSAYHGSLFKLLKLSGEHLMLLDTLKSRAAVYSLLELKLEQADAQGVNITFDALCDLSRITLSDVNLCRVLGILLDNAIEEASVSDSKQVNISVKHSVDNTIVFAISNATRGFVDVRRILADGYTTKANHSGIGLPQALHIINKHEHCSFRLDYHDGQFFALLVLPIHT